MSALPDAQKKPSLTIEYLGRLALRLFVDYLG